MALQSLILHRNDADNAWEVLAPPFFIQEAQGCMMMPPWHSEEPGMADDAPADGEDAAMGDTEMDDDLTILSFLQASVKQVACLIYVSSYQICFCS